MVDTSLSRTRSATVPTPTTLLSCPPLVPRPPPGIRRHPEVFPCGVRLAVLRSDDGTNPQHPGHAFHGVRGCVFNLRNRGILGRQAGNRRAVVVDAGFFFAAEQRGRRRRRGGRWGGLGVRDVGRKRRGIPDHVRVGEDRQQWVDEGRCVQLCSRGLSVWCVLLHVRADLPPATHRRVVAVWWSGADRGRN